jgi:hypothetical protein
MAIDWETTFREWAAAPSDTEQTRCNNAIGIVRRAISRSSDLSARRVDVFAQGSYRNHTNVPADSDVDVCALCHDVFFYELPKDANPAYFGLTNPATYSYPEYKNSVGSALLSYLGSSAVRRGNKAFNVNETTYHVDADVVACFDYRFYQTDHSYLQGTAFLTDQGIMINNWPDQNYQNGVEKNRLTGQRFKPLVRILKNLRNEMEEKGNAAAKPIPSYLIECIVWNVPNEGFGHPSLSEDVRFVIAHLYNKTLTPEDCGRWREVNNIKYLFHASQKWDYGKANQLALSAWNYLGFK